MTRRTERIGEQIQHELGHLLIERVKDPRVEQVTLTEVDVSPDLTLARVYYTIYLPTEEGAERRRRDAQRGLSSAAAFLRRELGVRLRLRKLPRLEFQFDESVLRAEKVHKVLEELKERGELGTPEEDAGQGEGEDR